MTGETEQSLSVLLHFDVESLPDKVIFLCRIHYVVTGVKLMVMW